MQSERFNQYFRWDECKDCTYLRPIKRDKTHTHPVNIPEHLIEGNVVGCDPANPGEVAECLEDIAREQVPDSRAQECV